MEALVEQTLMEGGGFGGGGFGGDAIFKVKADGCVDKTWTGHGWLIKTPFLRKLRSAAEFG